MNNLLIRKASIVANYLHIWFPLNFKNQPADCFQLDAEPADCFQLDAEPAVINLEGCYCKMKVFFKFSLCQMFPFELNNFRQIHLRLLFYHFVALG